MIAVRKEYEPNKTYPILVRLNGYCLIVEMLGSVVNDYNNSLEDGMVRRIRRLGTSV